MTEYRAMKAEPGAPRWIVEIVDAINDINYARRVFVDLSIGRHTEDRESIRGMCRLQAVQLGAAEDGLRRSIASITDNGAYGEGMS